MIEVLKLLDVICSHIFHMIEVVVMVMVINLYDVVGKILCVRFLYG